MKRLNDNNKHRKKLGQEEEGEDGDGRSNRVS